MTDFFLRVDRPENRHTWRFLDSDADGAEVAVEVSIPKIDWVPLEYLDKAEKFDAENQNTSIQDTMLWILSQLDPEGHKWIKANRKKIPAGALLTMYREFNKLDGETKGES